jgi:hypothetical protein
LRAILASTVMLLAIALAPSAIGAKHAMRCDALLSTADGVFCFATTSPTTYVGASTRTGASWQPWGLTTLGTPNAETVTYFAKVGGKWFLIDRSAGLMESADGHRFTPIDPYASSSLLSGGTTAQFENQPAVLLGQTGAGAAAAGQTLPLVPVTGSGYETSLFVALDNGAVEALGRPTAPTTAQTPLLLSKCDEAMSCLENAMPLGDATGVLASAPYAAPRVVIASRAVANHYNVYLNYRNQLRRSAWLSSFADRLQPNTPLDGIHVGWADAGQGQWYVRVVFGANTNSAVVPLPSDLLLRGSPQSDRWQVVAFARAPAVSRARPVSGQRLPWSAGACYQPNGAAIGAVHGHLFAEVCNGTTGGVYATAGDVRHWQLVLEP